MKASELKAQIIAEAFAKYCNPDHFHRAEIAKKFGLTPLVKYPLDFGEHSVSEFYQDENDEVVYSIGFREGTLFIKLGIVDARRALIHQVGFDHEHINEFSGNVVDMCDFKEYAYDGWHVGFEAFDEFLSALNVEAMSAQSSDEMDMLDTLGEFYKTGVRYSDAEECNDTLYSPMHLKFYGAVEEKYTVDNANNGTIIGEIIL